MEDDEICKLWKDVNFQASIGRVVDELQSDQYIQISEESDDLFRLRENKSSLIYWLMRFRDYKTAILKDLRPKKPAEDTFLDFEKIFCRLHDFRHTFSDMGLDYYVIEFNFNTSELIPDMKYRLPGNDNWIYRQRIDTTSGPGCRPVLNL